jgi:hypothetical protein
MEHNETVERGPFNVLVEEATEVLAGTNKTGQAGGTTRDMAQEGVEGAPPNPDLEEEDVDSAPGS